MSRASEDAQLKAALAPDAQPGQDKDPEARALVLSQGRAERRGDSLRLKLSGGRILKLFSRPKDCELDNVDRCVNYRFIADLPSRHAFLVDATHYEGGDILLIDDTSGRRTALPGIPIFGPDSQELISIDNCTAYGGDYDLQIWKRAGDHFVITWKHETDALAAPVEKEVASWSRPNRIELRLRSEDWLGHPSRRWSGALVRSGSGWRLEAKTPDDLRLEQAPAQR